MRKITALILLMLLLLGCMPVSAFAFGETEPALYHEEITYDAEGNAFKRILDEDGSAVIFESESDFETAAALPSAYDARDYGLVTSVKNQNPFGTCWAHAFCAAAESSLISQGYADKDSIDLSEAHLIWFRTHNYVGGSSNPALLDRRLIPDSKYDDFSYGGNDNDSVATVARWSGLTTEEKFSYTSNDSSKMNYPASDMFESDYQLSSAIFYNKSTDMSGIKQAIMKNGAVSTSYFYDKDLFNSSADGYCFYQNTESSTNHSVTVVGWNDSFSASNFKVTPPASGAWLVKNSWGTEWGDSGYFWLSYYDTSCNEFCEVNVRPAGSYDNNYQYDGVYCSGYYAYNKTSYAANIFTAKEKEIIKGTSFYIGDSSVYQCTVMLYTGLTSGTNPKSGTLKESKSFNCSKKGFYTIDFGSSYSVKAGEKFSVIIKFVNSNGGEARVRYEYLSDSAYSYNYAKGQSFYSSSGTSWNDCASADMGNIPIKVYTTDNVPETLTVSNLPKTEYSYTDKALDTTGLTLTLTYTDGQTETVTAGYTCSGFSTAAPGEKNITVSYNGLTAAYKINVTFVYADYTLVNKYIKDARAKIDSGDYTEDTVKQLNDAINAVIYGLTADKQNEVNAFAAAIKTAADSLTPSHIHSYKKSTVKPTCTAQGYTTYACECGDSYISDYVPAKGHTEGEWVVTRPATEAAKGEKTLYCSECHAVIRTGEIPRLNPADKKVRGVSVEDNIAINYKADAKINPTVSADSGVNYKVEYKSSDSGVASVDSNGNVHGTRKWTKSTATVTCTVTDEFGNSVSDTCNVSVGFAWWQWIIGILLLGFIWY